jgi:subtilase family serine protease
VLAGARTVPELAAGATSAGTTLVTLPSNPGIGYFYVFAKADADNAIVESDETNNTMVTLIQIGGDLIVSALNAPTTAGAGTAIVVTDTTTNNGSATVQTSTTRFYLSTNGIVDAGDVQLDGAHVVPELAAGASHASSTTVTVPATVASGTYYLLAKADGDNAVVETQEGNNVALRQIQIGTDLLISSLGVPAKGGSGLPITITDTTKNQGGAMTPPSVTRFYLSSNVNLDSSDTLLSPGRAVPALDPGTASTGSTTVTLPAIAGGGVYYIIAKADGDNAIPESSETNNTAFASIQVGSDLVVASFSVPVNAGLAPFVVADTITNQGAGTAAASTTRYYLSGYAYLDSRAVLLSGERAVPALAAGETNTGSATVAVPDGTAAGSYYLLAKADADNVVAESQEFNNTNVRAIAIGPDLVTSGFAVPSAAAAGATISVTDVVTNQGADPADASTTRFYLSANVLLDASDVLLSGVHQVPPLAAGQSSTGVTSIVIPAGTVARYYYVIAASDADNAVRESSETNNSFARLIQVTSP